MSPLRIYFAGASSGFQRFHNCELLVCLSYEREGRSEIFALIKVDTKPTNWKQTSEVCIKAGAGEIWVKNNGYEEGQRSPRKDNLFRTESSDICADTFSWTHSDKCSQIILCNRLFRQENTRLNQITPEKCRFSRLESADYGEPHYVRYDDDEDI